MEMMRKSTFRRHDSQRLKHHMEKKSICTTLKNNVYVLQLEENNGNIQLISLCVVFSVADVVKHHNVLSLPLLVVLI